MKEHCNDWRAGERQSWPPEGPGRVRESQAAMTQGGPGEPGDRGKEARAREPETGNGASEGKSGNAGGGREDPGEPGTAQGGPVKARERQRAGTGTTWDYR